MENIGRSLVSEKNNYKLSLSVELGESSSRA
jgi:hypothetical protein